MRIPYILLSKPQRPPASVMSLFSNGEPGDIWLPHFTKYAFQDAAMTIPAVVGMPVVKMVGIAKGTIATFANVTLQESAAGKRYLASNGTSSAGQTTAINFSAVDKMTVIAGVYKASDAAAGVLAELTADANNNNGSFLITAPASINPNYGAKLRGTVAAVASGYNMATYTAPHTAVLAVQLDLAGANKAAAVKPYVNGVLDQGEDDGGALNTGGNFANAALNLLARNNGAAGWVNGRAFGWIVRGSTAAATAGQLADANAYMASLTG